MGLTALLTPVMEGHPLYTPPPPETFQPPSLLHFPSVAHLSRRKWVLMIHLCHRGGGGSGEEVQNNVPKGAKALIFTTSSGMQGPLKKSD